MKLFSIFAAALFSVFPLSAMAGFVSSKLNGTWIETEQVKGNPRTVLHFEGRKLRFENLFDQSAIVEYRVTEKNANDFSISFEYSYKVKRGNGRIVERTATPEFLFHVENGRPILSQKEFEYDGRGPILLGEFLREEDFIDGFRSELKHRLNDRPIPSMMKEEPFSSQ